MALTILVTHQDGYVPDGLVIDHLCRVTSCVNPNHLEVVTVGENNRRGRATKLTEAHVREIRRLARAGGLTQREIAERYGVTQGAIHLIVKGANWRDS